MGKRKLALCYLSMILIVCFVSYGSLETAVRGLGLPDPVLIRNIEKELASADSIENYFEPKPPTYGWDQDMISMPTELNAPINDTICTILFSGDSVTRGIGVDVTKEAYPMLLLKALSEKMNVRVLNAAVSGFGVDQMMLKLEELVPKYRPCLIVFAYIPHDLWRPARNINFGYTKPVLIADSSGKWKIIPSLNIMQFYKDYSNAKHGYYLGLWSLSHWASNLRYYYPKLYASYYRELFEEIRNRLIALAEQHDADLLIVRLASTWPGDLVSFLDRMAQQIFASPELERYHYTDTEDCVRAKAAASGIHYDKEFRQHPSAVGHEIYSDCLVDSLRAFSFRLR